MSHATKPRKAKSQGRSTSCQPSNASPPPASSQSAMLQRWEVESQKNNLPFTDWRWLPQDSKTKETNGKS
ncbi:hypothetical protein VP1G_10636 [Cytospora mali]|uniref:Uncharacterized protein n=1 Tax=Cytospora mali TaxID=578113 RepID=A0A194UT27_CYTMA|nr:hypothetical protein VP1G_10636 [Valsa mali var. pyri (nom. inval.)]